MRDVLRFQSWPLRLFGTATSALAGFAVLLALTGCYGMLSYSVTRRTREFGIRAALGATPVMLGWSIARQSAVMAIIAIPAAMVVSEGLSRVAVAILEAAPPFGVSAFVVGAAAGIGTAAVASYLPSRRARRADPVLALRAE